MSFSALTGVYLKLTWLFLKICRWFLVEMSLNCKFSGSNGRLSNSLKLKKEREAMRESNSGWKWSRPLIFSLLLVLLMGCFWLFSAVNDEALKKMDNQDLCEYQAQILLEYLNVSKEELSSLASLFSVSDQTTHSKCSKQSGYAIAPRYVVGCALKVLSSVDQKIKWHGWAAELIEAKRHCPVQDQNILGKFVPSMPGDGSAQFISQFMPCSSLPNYQASEEHVWRRTALDNLTREHCRGVSFCLVKACWWVLVGIALSCCIPSLHEKLRSNRKQKLAQQQTLSEQHLQQQLLLQQKQQQQTHSSSRSTGKWRKKLLFMFVLAGVVGSIWLFWHLNQDIMFRRKETLANMCDERARMLQDQFNVSMNHVHALAILISTFHHGKQPSAIDQETFKQYTEHTAFERPLTSGVAYAFRVLHSEREQFEKQHGEIKKMENEDQSLVQDCRPENLDPSPVQDEYAPVIFSQETVAHINSIDMMSGKEDRENILRARASGKGVLTSPFKLLKSNHLGVVLTFAVYNTPLPRNVTSEQRINATVGYLGASYDVPSLVKKLLHQLASKQTIVVNVYDTTNRSAPIMMYGNDTTDTGLLHISNLDFGDPARNHEMHCRFKQKPPPPWTAIIASVGVLVITLLLGHIFHAAINQISKVEDDYRAMMELKHRAEAADVAKSQFLATVSHEIRTPMNGVLGMLQMLMDTNLDATQMDYTETAHASGKELISLINEVLDQAKIESGRLELEAVPFDLRDVLDNVLSLFSGKSHEKGFELAVYVSSQVPEVVIGDPGRFRQIITNLVGNSVKFTDNKKKGHIFVSVHVADEVRCAHCMRDEVLMQSLTFLKDSPNASYSTLSGLPVVHRSKSLANFKNLNCPDSREETGMIKLLVTVEDTGVGIPLEAQSRIFMPFMQADSSTSRTYGGTGIGLSISKRLVDLMGGEIGFVSEHGTGSTFSFTAAFTKGETSSLDTNRQQYDQTVSKFGGLQALVVDSKSIRAEVARYHLQRLGISVDVFSSVDSACSYMSGHSKGASGPLSMVLIDKDIWDSETGGAFRSLIKEFRPNGCTEVLEIPPKIFLLATCISTIEQNELKSTGLVDNVITKPLRRSVLISCFQEAAGIGKKRRIMRGRPSDLGNLLKDKHILVVDDNLVNRRVAEGHLKKYGAIVTCVDSGKAALEMLKPPHKFDACFMDLQMPEMDGFEATRQIRWLESKFNEKIDSGETINGLFQIVARWHTPILAMTADVIQATNEKCTECGMDDYVSKPFEEGQLYSVVARFFQSG